MKINDIVTEAAVQPDRYAAYDQLTELYRRANYKYFEGEKPFAPEELEPALKQAARLIKITGRRFTGWRYSSGYLYDDIVTELRSQLAKLGNNIFPNSRSTTGFAKELAVYYGGSYQWANPIRWQRGDGARHSDPADYVVFPDKEHFEDAWADLQTKGKRVYIKDHPRYDPTTYVKIGGLLITPSSITRGAFSDNPETTYRLSVQSAKILNNWMRSQVDITDQQAAALQDIAATKNANNMATIKALMSILAGEQDIKQVIDRSQKLRPQDKAKLDAIIAGAKDFKEP